MTETVSRDGAPGKPKPKVALILPLFVVALLLSLLFTALRTTEPSSLPSALIGKTLPDFDLPGLLNSNGESGPVTGLSSAAFKSGKAVILNFWASWCAPCIAEHPQLTELSRQGIPLYSINYKDKPEAARRFLANHGNPFRAIGADEGGFAAIDFGVYGVPETFVIDGNGRIVYRFAGPLSPEIVAQKILPAIKKAEQEVTAPHT